MLVLCPRQQSYQTDHVVEVSSLDVFVHCSSVAVRFSWLPEQFWQGRLKIIQESSGSSNELEFFIVICSLCHCIGCMCMLWSWKRKLEGIDCSAAKTSMPPITTLRALDAFTGRCPPSSIDCRARSVEHGARLHRVSGRKHPQRAASGTVFDLTRRKQSG